MKYELVLGLEIHLQLNTSEKMFCKCENNPFSAENPNTLTCPVCLGLPGALPVPNKKAIESAQKMAYALKSNIQNKIIFERKNYFYPDLPKGYQITCPHYPISIGGKLDMSYWTNQSDSFVGFREIHLEEDTAKSMHKGSETSVDFNKSGVPLLEIVTEPDFHDIEIAVDFCKEIQRIARAVQISEADMEKGNMRLEANVSMRKVGSKKLPNYRVELKNINSFGFMRKAIASELRRQSEALGKGEKLSQETRGFDESKGTTFVQRSKEDAHDYRYFPEPDIPVIEIDNKWILNITTSLLDLPSVTRQKLLDSKISKEYVDILVENVILRNKYDELIILGYSPLVAANLVINISLYKSFSAHEIHLAEKEKLDGSLDAPDSLNPIINEVISENLKAVEDYKNGKEIALTFMLGQIMQKSKGKADPKVSKDLLQQQLQKS